MILQSIKMAWEAITSNKLRSFLTMLGIIIGVVALVVLVSLVNGATGAVTSEITSLGNDMVTVNVRDDKGSPIRLEDLDEISALVACCCSAAEAIWLDMSLIMVMMAWISSIELLALELCWTLDSISPLHSFITRTAPLK